MRARMTSCGWLLCVGLLVAATPRPAMAEEHRFLVCYPGGPGSTEDAQERLNVFLAALGNRLGATLAGEYHTSRAACDDYLSRENPKMGLFPLEFFLKKKKSLALIPVGEPIREGAGNGVVRYHLVASPRVVLEGAQDGMRLASSHIQDPGFVTRVVFDGRVDVSRFQLVRVSSGLRALKYLKKGKADLVLLDESEHVAMGELAFARDFMTLVSSAQLPGAPVVVLQGDKALAKRLKPVITTLCAASPVACERLEMREIRPVTSKTYRTVLKSARP